METLANLTILLMMFIGCLLVGMVGLLIEEKTGFFTKIIHLLGVDDNDGKGQ